MTALTLPYLIIDIETADAGEKEVQAIMGDWTPPKRWTDPEKIERNRLEFEAKAYEKAALLDASPIICIGYGGEKALTVHTLNDAQDGRYFSTEKAMLDAFDLYLVSKCSAGTELVGHNIQGFDLPKLRLAYIRNGLKVPSVLRYMPERRQPCYDTQQQFRYFSTEHNRNYFASLELVCRTLGIEYDDGGMKGADVPAAYLEGRHQEILDHCLADIETTGRVYRAMVGL